MPDAPPPTYYENGNLALGWLIVLRYDPSKKVVTLSWSKDGDLYRQSRHGAVAYEHHAVPDMIEGTATTLWMLTDPSLL